MMTPRHVSKMTALLMLLMSTCAGADAPQRSTEIALANRLTWGATLSDVRQMDANGIEAWLHDQLYPTGRDDLPPAATAQIKALPMLQKSAAALALELDAQVTAAKAAQAAFATMPSAQPQPNPPMAPGTATATMSPAPNAPPTPQQVRNTYLGEAQRETQARHMLRDLYAPHQLREQMTWFWFNHFNVYTDKGEIRIFLADYEDRALRPNALGNFRTLLEATLRSPAMLQYLDNAQNAAGHINENYAREIMELHTMGVGSGYSQQDVQELARILTGVGVAPPNNIVNVAPKFQPLLIHDGMFVFNPQRHDFGEKMFLGHVIHGSGYDEVRQALDILCAQPATAQHISRQLAQYFVADAPPPSLVNAMAQRFLTTNGDIAAVLDLMIHSPEFRASLGKPLLKDPQHYVISAVRMAYDDRVILNTRPMLNWLNQLAEPLYGHLTPDGYPMDRTAWNGPGQVEQRFEIAQAIGSGNAGLFKADGPNTIAQPAFPNLQGALFYNGLSETLAPQTRAGLAQATSPQEWNIFFLASPDFMRR